MGDLTELALSTITQAQRRVEVLGQNMANATTPAFKRRVAFSQLVGPASTNGISIPQIGTAVDNRPGKLVETGNPSDLALSGAGVFAVRRGSDVDYVRSGQFTIDGEGRLVDARGYALQLTNGNDAIVKSANFKVGIDGSLIENGATLGRIAVFAQVPEATGFDGLNIADETKLVPVDDAGIRQGAYETSNVTTGDEMVALIEAVRRAESGQRLMNVYDELMGRIITTFGEGAR